MALINQLKGQIMQKTSKNIDIAQIASTFKTQDLQSKKKEDVVVEDALAHDLEKGEHDDLNDDDDESYNPNGPDAFGGNTIALDDQKPHNWDDEENIKSITEGDLADCVQSSADVASISGSVKVKTDAKDGSVALD